MIKINQRSKPKNIIIHVCSVHKLGDNRINKHIKTLLKLGYSVKYSNISKSSSKIEDNNGLEVEHFDFDCIPRKNPISYFKTLFLLFLSILKTKSNFLHLHDVYLLPLAVIAKICGKKVIYDKHEFYETEGSLVGILSQIFDVLYSKFIDGVVIVSEKQSKYLVDHKFRNIICIPNYQSAETFLNSTQSNENKKTHSQINIIYFGSLAETDRNILLMLDVVEIILSTFSNVIFELGGETRDEVVMNKIIEIKNKHDRFIYYEYMEHTLVIEKTLLSDIGFMLFKKTPNSINCSPNKIFEYFMAGVVVIGMGGGEAFNLVTQNNCGKVFGFNESKETIVEYIKMVINDTQKLRMMKENSRRVGQNYSWESIEERYKLIYEAVKK